MKKTRIHNPELLNRLLSGNAKKEEYQTELKKSAVLIEDFVKRADLPPLLSAISTEYANDTFPQLYDLTEPDVRSGLIISMSHLLFWSHPEWVLPLGFDEVRFRYQSAFDPTVRDDLRGGVDEIIGDCMADDFRWDFGGTVNEDILKKIELNTDKRRLLAHLFYLWFKAPQFRTPDGVWHDIEYVTDRFFLNQQEGEEQDMPFMDWLSLWRSNWVSYIRTNASPTNATIYMPALQTPISNYPDIQLQNTIRRILMSIANEKTNLVDLHWRTLEEIIAELLFDSGLEVQITSKSRDGGRDIIARGELFPGEPAILAVEAKHMKVVPISELRAALWANRQYPALLFATSGKFSAGVYREKQEHENVLRLYLKDGMALQQWIHEYATQHRLLTKDKNGG
ncbi:MAG TPA: restriction endonuclease [Candidatus Saccharimonadales bacterium]|nr:restriction endonuclease [Candidatus Saccharimonadales bacterium]